MEEFNIWFLHENGEWYTDWRPYSKERAWDLVLELTAYLRRTNAPGAYEARPNDHMV